MTNKDKKEKLEQQGIIVCCNWLRGCFNETTDDFKKCLICREKNRELDKDKRKNKLTNAIKYNTNNDKNKMCKKCNGIESIDTYDLITNKCSICSKKSKVINQLRNPRDKEKIKLYDYKKSAKNRGLKFELSDEYFFDLVQLPCHYCGYNESIIGIDRKDSNIGYIKNNVVPCCEMCNLMKNDKSYDDFIKICSHIISINNKSKKNLNHELFHISSNGQYARFKNDASKRNIKFELSKDDFIKIVLKNCFYCNSSGNGYYGTGAGGIDRVESAQGYSINNCVPCCYTCNSMKLNYLKDDFLKQCIKIVDNINKCDYLENDIMDFFEKYTENKNNVKREIPTFFHSNDYYEIRKWNGNLDDLKNVKIELEFVENSDQKDIWNYYRWKISSLKTFKPDNFIGRVICILIKDSINNKYLGIMSLSSDIISMKNRDDEIGWTIDDKIKNKKLNNLMNLSTCVSIQPFGFNFNGGKLLARLAFSKEIVEKFREKFNQELLAIVTTGLYGKSVQYSRLKEFNYVGNTKGNSVYWIPEEITNKCRLYLKKYHNFNSSGLKKLHIISKIISVLNLDKEKILMSNEKGIYVGYTRVDSKKYLCGKKTKLNECKFKSSQEIFNEWYERWAVQRYNHLLKTQNLIIYHNQKSTERATRHYEKLKKELGEEKYKEYIKDKNQKTYSNKKNKMKEIIKTVSQSYIDKSYVNEMLEQNKQKKDSEQNDPNKLKLPSNFSYYLEKDSPYFSFNKNIKGQRLNTKYKLRSKNIQKEFNDFIAIVNSKFPQLEIGPYQIPNVPSTLNLTKELTKTDESNTDSDTGNTNTNTPKPVMPTNFSITTINSVDYIQFCKKIDDKKYQYKTKINSYDIKSELDRFIDELNEKYQLELIKSDYPIVNTNGWETTNQIIQHSDSAEKQSQRERTRRYLEKKKQEMGEEEFRKQNADKAKSYRQFKQANKELDV